MTPTPKELNRLVAEALGWTRSEEYEGWYTQEEYEAFDESWHPSTNLQQAVDNIVPVLNEMGWYIEVTNSTPYKDVCFAKAAQYDGFHVRECGSVQGTTPSERMAWALCEVFLKVKEGK